MSSRSANSSRINSYWKKFLPWLESCAIAAWGIVLTKLWLSGQLYLLVHPNYIPLTAIAGLGLLAVGGIEAWRVVQRRRYNYSNDQQHVSLIKPSLSSSILLVVAVIALFINPRPFTSEKAIHRGVIENIADARTIPKSFRASNRPEERTLVEWVRTISSYPEPDAYKGQKAKITGFVVHAPDQPDNMFLLTRFVITCCAADVYPVSLPVKITENRSNYPPDRWLQIEGQADVENNNGKRQVVIVANNITAIAEPKNPYDY
ncbi:TIGR03943 family protein [Pseudanabaena sp. FACHB-1998]|uniref:TIGR03943 family putative permease subunit n=1 Tax=Pseudanabaena sp. FACHB-1998 TaxID=2692858 RepID=UPI0016813849|nr:TIGR03943 family protein [Pseudanabaena sp. FACHB-1998]MBD2176419.1 TIGR03943 family protein [Pseudanabaena sp. FACHB-1998]